MTQNWFLYLCIAVVALAWIYILFVRELLVEMWPAKFARWHAVEDKLWDRSRTLLIARLYIAGSIIIAVHDALAAQGAIDWTPLITQITSVVPEPYRPIALAVWLALTGVAMEWLRRTTTGTVAERKIQR
jgi:hypothetical protein